MNDLEALLFQRLNKLRTAHGLHRLVWGTDRMHRDGRRHCRDMAEARAIFHDVENPAFPLPADCTMWGQNVGEGPAASDVHRAFVESPPHLANLLSRRYGRVTVSVIGAGGLVWVTQNFVAP